MKTKATVKLVGELKRGISTSTGNEWKNRSVLLEWLDSEGTHRVWASLFNRHEEKFSEQNIIVGDTVEVSLRFSSRSYRTGFTSTEVQIEDIQKLNA